MDKIIRVDEDVISIGTGDGSIKEVRREDCSNFEPAVGDIVEIFNTETKIIVMKKEPEKEKPKEEISGQQISGIPGGININLSNSQNIQPQVEQYGPVVYGDGELHVVNKVAYVLFAIFLGNIGVHKFYAGYTGQGILYLLFCWTWIPCLIGLVEGLIAAFKSADSNGRIVV